VVLEVVGCCGCSDCSFITSRDEDYCPLGCGAVYPGRHLQIFQRNSLSSSSTCLGKGKREMDHILLL
jgi:hypothetical protein